jgi:hypothetical protein
VPTNCDETLTDSSFSNQASRNSGGMEFWDSFDDYRTPPPFNRMGGMTLSTGEDIPMDTSQLAGPGSIATDLAKSLSRPTSRSPILSTTNPPLATEFRRKRLRDDDLDPESFKRRAVSPGMSVQSSPVLPPPSLMKDGNSRSLLPKSTSGTFGLERDANSSGGNSGHTGSIKRIGLQGMNETSDGLMNMSIE